MDGALAVEDLVGTSLSDQHGRQQATQHVGLHVGECTACNVADQGCPVVGTSSPDSPGVGVLSARSGAGPWQACGRDACVWLGLLRQVRARETHLRLVVFSEIRIAARG